MRRLKATQLITAVPLMLGLFSFAAFAGEGKGYGQETGQFAPNLQKADELIGVAIQNRSGEKIGTIKDLVLGCPAGCCAAYSSQKQGYSPRSAEETALGSGQGRTCLQESRVAYIVISPGDAIQVQHDYLVIPWNATNVRPAKMGQGGRAHFVLHTDSSALQNAPGFNRDQWPDLSTQEWRSKIQQSFDVGEPGFIKEKSGKSMPGMRSGDERSGEGWTYGESGMQRTGGMSREDKIERQRLTQLFGTGVKDENGDNVGELKNVLIDTRDGVIAFAVIAHGGVLGMGKDLAALPWSVLQFQSDRDVFTTTVSRDDLDQLAVAEENFSQLNDIAQARRLFSRFDAQPYWETFGYIDEGRGSGMEKSQGDREGDQDKSEKSERGSDE